MASERRYQTFVLQRPAESPRAERRPPPPPHPPRPAPAPFPLPAGVDACDLLLLGLMWLLWKDSGDRDFLIMLGVLALGILQ